MGVRVWILVYAGDPVDLCKYRHASLFIRFGDELPDCGTLFHITGAQRSFQFEEQPGYNPLKSSKLRNMVEVGDISAQVSNVRFILATTRVRNGIEDADWNCQNWVGDALQKFVEQRWLRAEQRDVAIDHMVQTCLQATDEK
ncbi:hypothetical protein PAAG_03059 [Paracoccidioides lutzii Pb01]|uniref:Uncharacterized protein n=1 Tax=Paracoccidioides lutzii (strain ATCC MYA-826 / Pb01) TaxID=502779 RepID=C1GYA5_PARBA|nr:hypothetical protein PAAG_03059 [Paracoccidioides lutzii Pb01]EEH41496.1 hypothetical protein PAAG_03059 [Paracoccidioides lutzii Pb01]